MRDVVKIADSSRNFGKTIVILQKNWILEKSGKIHQWIFDKSMAGEQRLSGVHQKVSHKKSQDK